MTPADLGKPIAAIVERCGAPGSVMSLGAAHQALYVKDGQTTTIWFDADQMRARIIQLMTIPQSAAQQPDAWNVTLPFASGAHEVVLGKTTLADAQSALAVDADVTTDVGAAFRGTANTDVLLAASDDRVVVGAFVGERPTLAQLGMIASPIDAPPLDYMAPIPRDAWLRPRTAATGPRSTIFRIETDAAGIVRNVTIVTASGDSTFDAATQQRLSDAVFRPATLEHRPIAGTCFVQVRH